MLQAVIDNMQNDLHSRAEEMTTRNSQVLLELKHNGDLACGILSDRLIHWRIIIDTRKAELKKAEPVIDELILRSEKKADIRNLRKIGRHQVNLRTLQDFEKEFEKELEEDVAKRFSETLKTVDKNKFHIEICRDWLIVLRPKKAPVVIIVLGF